ncbi:regulatory LuxR family protein [Kribbella voronezhensis]|uniref:Regulatory LuxR family protein n=1 Tax=Kribbella voronezhensis TaxID=2512212 RepID=A0A4V3FJ04_9ACTN|nr:LuxR family transcriptional regulator [Kribbella voronezhensis]TDU84473.1 regulatory LuxR family protein [Kribbella voronezhensis]
MGDGARIVGRDREIEQLQAALTAARNGTANAIFLIGEPGIGKTRLATEAINRAVEAGMVAVRGRASTIGPIVPYRPLIEAVQALSRAGNLPELSSLGTYGGVLGRLVPSPSNATGSTVGSSVVVAEALIRLLTVVGDRRGCLFVLDDLHDADAETLAIVEYMLDNLGPAPVVLLLACRAEACAAMDLAVNAGQRRTATVLEPEALTREQIHLLASHRLDVHPDDVPAWLLDRLSADSAGNPFVVEELVFALGRQSLEEPASLAVPVNVARSVARRADRLGRNGRNILTTAAVIGHRFALPLLRQAAGATDDEILEIVEAGVASQLVRPDGPTADWYAFRHPLTAEALISELSPSERAGSSRQVADAIASLYPELPGEWCARSAELREYAGEPTTASRLYAEAGRRALAAGAVKSAVTLLVRADLDPNGDLEYRADLLGDLLLAVAESGDFSRIPSLEKMLEELTAAGLSPARRAVLHAKFANAAHIAGDQARALEQIVSARALLGPNPAAAESAQVDVISAYIELGRPNPERLQVAAELAGRAAKAGEDASLPIVTCDALQLVGYLTRDRDDDRANQLFQEAREIAIRNELPIFRVYSEVFLSRSLCLRTGQTSELEEARQSALHIGALPLAYEAAYLLALQRVQRCEFADARRELDESLTTAIRLRLGRTVPFLRLGQAISAAHQGNRTEMEKALDLLTVEDQLIAGVRPSTFGLARAVCSLLEEDSDRASQELAQAIALDLENPTMLDFGKNGLILLLGVLEGLNGWEHYSAVAERSASRTRWNTQFTQFAHAVLLGRDGDVEGASRAAAAALEAAEIYPLGRHLALRLVIQAAYDDGWGEPVVWAREAEEYFQANHIVAVASACRGLLRSMGAPVRQRRTGDEAVPPDLRKLGVTVRELEVGRLLAQRIPNKAIAKRLHISPRTVEKHVANLLTKTGQHDRDAFASFAQDSFS